MAALVTAFQVLKVLICAEEILIGGCFFTCIQYCAVQYHLDMYHKYWNRYRGADHI